jgi:hypothetical protein
MQTLFWAHWGSAPNVLASYDASVRRLVGVQGVGAYSYARPALANSFPRIVDVAGSPEGTFVALELYSRDSPVRRESFLLKREGNEWAITYDTLLDRLLTQYVRLVSGGDLTGKRLRPQDVKLAESAATEYRALLVGKEGDEDGDRGSGKGSGDGGGSNSGDDQGGSGSGTGSDREPSTRDGAPSGGSGDKSEPGGATGDGSSGGGGSPPTPSGSAPSGGASP